ncbi:hypothetical protein H6F67_25740 [Microcoleus sp. FACHB-1515]|uniref:hypothetical protein n=1 Tax=Cyanophyceae TaxID=3028117 RepID=UPI001683FC25|nr:hypothetical protein [Microcoleus sp. FACHB-1515]MBD2093251.1 hypothetical protein [Microcoleus sp. FACHB-1515]
MKTRLRSLPRNRALPIRRSDFAFIGICLLAIAYLLIREPLLLAILGCASIVHMGSWQIVRALPIVEKWLSAKITPWHVGTMIMATTAVFAVLPHPAHAIFLSGLENFVTDIANSAGTAGGGTAIPATTVALVFNMIRAVFLLLVGAAALYSYNQAQQGNDWRPIASQVGIAFGAVLGIDVITFLFIGNGQTA